MLGGRFCGGMMLAHRRFFCTSVDEKLIRISKRVAMSGMCSRRQAEALVEAKRVNVNGALPELWTKVGPKDVVRVDGKVIGQPKRARMFIAHKLNGEMVSRTDPEGRPTIMQRLELMGLPKPLFAVGRLDFDSEGLLLFTNDGDLKRELELPRNSVTRTYKVRASGRVYEKALQLLRRGAWVDGVKYRPMRIAVESANGEEAWLKIELNEGKNREIRKCLTHVGLTVTRLLRTAFGPYELSRIPRGSALEVSALPAQRLVRKIREEQQESDEAASPYEKVKPPQERKKQE